MGMVIPLKGLDQHFVPTAQGRAFVDDLLCYFRMMESEWRRGWETATLIITTSIQRTFMTAVWLRVVQLCGAATAAPRLMSSAGKPLTCQRSQATTVRRDLRCEFRFGIRTQV